MCVSLSIARGVGVCIGRGLGICVGVCSGVMRGICACLNIRARDTSYHRISVECVRALCYSFSRISSC